MLIEERIEELSLCRREGLEECVFLLPNLCLRAVDDSHLLAVVCYHVFAVGHNTFEATTARDDVPYRRHVIADEDVVAGCARDRKGEVPRIPLLCSWVN